MATYETIKQTLLTYQQEHLLHFYDQLTETEQQSLLTQIDQIDFENLKETSQQQEERATISALPSHSAEMFTTTELVNMHEHGLSLLADGKVAVVLLAGGQGTRLGHNGPKGTVNMDGTAATSLFALQAKRIQALQQEVKTTISWYIMTSPINDEETTTFFKENGYFGLKPEQITFFLQDVSPALTPEGKVMLEDKGTVFQAPNGNGGVFASMQKAGILAELKNNHVKWVFFNNIDNALVQVADPYFLGYADQQGAAISSKSVKKADPNEKVGVLGQRDGKPSVIEYSELTEEQRHQPELQDANIGIHLFDVEFLEQTADQVLPYHLAHKKISTIKEDGTTVQPLEPNGYKLEKFYFDVFPYASNMSIFQVERANEFLPVKNKTGKDSLEEAQKRFN
ncbi:UDPGP type 1 family protein [Shouchella sp. 1P09AA]|uniref:UDPGP type 1 family protein n=1 Tax=unclassified Shouchella TaxID=2893065 RepID=UPI0039A20758